MPSRPGPRHVSRPAASGALVGIHVDHEREEGPAFSPVHRGHPPAERRSEADAGRLLVLEEDIAPGDRVPLPDPHGRPHARVVGAEQRDPGRHPEFRSPPVLRGGPRHAYVEPAAYGVETHRRVFKGGADRDPAGRTGGARSEGGRSRFSSVSGQPGILAQGQGPGTAGLQTGTRGAPHRARHAPHPVSIAPPRSAGLRPASRGSAKPALITPRPRPRQRFGLPQPGSLQQPLCLTFVEK